METSSSSFPKFNVGALEVPASDGGCGPIAGSLTVTQSHLSNRCVGPRYFLRQCAAHESQIWQTMGAPQGQESGFMAWWGNVGLQAEIAAVHVTAPTWDSTDWAAIVAAYDGLAEVSPSPIVALNRAVAVSMLAGPSAGLGALKVLERPLADYHLFYAARA